MLDEINDQTVSVADIRVSLESNKDGILDGQFWELNNDLCEGILSERWEALTDLEKFSRLFEIIELWPCYSTASFLPRLQIAGVDAKAETFLWQKIVLALEHGERRHREAIEYVLWVDFFEDQAVSVKAWNGVLGACPSKEAKRRLLANSGPVPYAEKRYHYHELTKNPADHELLVECLARSLQDVYGDIDHADAKAMLKKLCVKPANKFMSYLQENL
jgi:hypothetical protein